MIPIRPIPSPTAPPGAAPLPLSLTLGHPVIDHDHAEFVALVQPLGDLPDAEFVQGFTTLVQHVREHFAREDALMEASGFPALKWHHAEHQRVIDELLRLQDQVDQGQIAVGRTYVREIAPAWFNLHLRTMDNALATHLRRTGHTEHAPDTSGCGEAAHG